MELRDAIGEGQTTLGISGPRVKELCFVVGEKSGMRLHLSPLKNFYLKTFPNNKIISRLTEF